jgi:diacylglycerol kinase
MQIVKQKLSASNDSVIIALAWYTQDMRRRALSFKYAFSGIKAAFLEEPNLKLHFVFAVIVALLGCYLQISKIEWLILTITIGLVLTAELTNTSIEAVVDSFTDKEHPGAKLAKDISAGAVLIVSLTAAIIGAIIFLPYLITLPYL